MCNFLKNLFKTDKYDNPGGPRTYFQEEWEKCFNSHNKYGKCSCCGNIKYDNDKPPLDSPNTASY